MQNGRADCVDLHEGLPNVVFDGVGVPSELMGDGVLVPSSRLKAEAGKYLEGVGADARDVLAEDVER